jgi:hypothetical protein
VVAADDSQFALCADRATSPADRIDGPPLWAQGPFHRIAISVKPISLGGSTCRRDYFEILRTKFNGASIKESAKWQTHIKPEQ